MLLRHPLATLLHRYVHLLSVIVPPIEWWQAHFALTSAQVFSHTDCNGLVFFFLSNQWLDYILSYRT